MEFSFLCKCVHVIVEVVSSHDVVMLEWCMIVEQCRLLGMHEVIAHLRHAEPKPATWLLLRPVCLVYYRLFDAIGSLGNRLALGLFKLEHMQSPRVRCA